MNTTDTLHQLEKELNVLLTSRKHRNLTNELHLARRRWAKSVVDKGVTESPYAPSKLEISKAKKLIASPIFIGGNPRSGTTLLRDLIDGHPAICSLPCEPLYFEFLSAKVSGLNKEDSFRILCSDWLEKLIDPMSQPPYWILSKNEPDSLRYLEYVRICRGWWNLMGEVRPDSLYYRHVVPFMLGYATCLGGGKINTDTLYWMEKSPGLELNYDQLKKEFPKALFVNMIRNPKDSFVSLKVSLMNSGVHRIPLQYFLKSSLRFNALLRIQSHDNCLTVRYEQLVANRNAVINSVFAFLSLEPEEINLKQTIRSMLATPNSSIGKSERSEIHLSKKELLLLSFSADKVLQHFSYPVVKVNTLLSYMLRPLFYFIKFAYSRRHSFLQSPLSRKGNAIN
ncbi:sulfotransferase [Roseivirga sp. E12]|uniref:sulfotransferase family protein n=1 Tax=Roseivirga sp. E12 TaxID=2819237 RepID=UPI001ABD3669|nr:sulfotransferase [Roseivirga sp. E12]MBO3699323.1 sulfotransferase [Roseivirga sp. E12]